MSAVLAPSAPSTTGLTSARFGAHIAQRSSLPKWWLDAKQAAWNQFAALPLPTRNQELWRFSNLRGISLDGFEVAEPFSGASASAAPATFTRSAEILFANNYLASRTAVPPELLAKGVIFCPLEEALARHGELVRTYFQKHPAGLGGEKFVALNTAFTSSGAFLYVPKGVEIAAPFVIQHAVSGSGKSIFPHTLAILDDHAKATVVEFFTSSESSSHFASGVNDLHAGTAAQLTYVGAQTLSESTLAFQSNSIVAQRDARVLSLNLHLGGRQARHESHSRLQGPGAHSEMLALTVARGVQEFDQRTLQTHQASNTSSNLLYKNALLDTARTIFSGLIVVEPDAQKTDAYQSNRNLMLSDLAEANSLPGLEIRANDVRCTHGSTTARVPAEQEFYLWSRGVKPAQANELLVFGFFEEVLARLEDLNLQEALRHLLRATFLASRP